MIFLEVQMMLQDICSGCRQKTLIFTSNQHCFYLGLDSLFMGWWPLVSFWASLIQDKCVYSIFHGKHCQIQHSLEFLLYHTEKDHPMYLMTQSQYRITFLSGQTGLWYFFGKFRKIFGKYVFEKIEIKISFPKISISCAYDPVFLFLVLPRILELQGGRLTSHSRLRQP